LQNDRDKTIKLRNESSDDKIIAFEKSKGKGDQNSK
jgi:hypothetical protein